MYGQHVNEARAAERVKEVHSSSLINDVTALLLEHMRTLAKIHTSLVFESVLRYRLSKRTSLPSQRGVNDHLLPLPTILPLCSLRLPRRRWPVPLYLPHASIRWHLGPLPKAKEIDLSA
jgi:hypothetical protein